MLTREIIEYVESELGRGRSPGEIRENLLESGWSDEDLRLAFSTAKPRRKLPVGYFVLPVLLLIGISLWFLFPDKKPVQTETVGTSVEEQAVVPAPSPSVTPVRSKIVNYPVEIIQYYNSVGKYSFRCPSTWAVYMEGSQSRLKMANLGQTVKISDPDSMRISVVSYDKTEKARSPSVQTLAIANNLDSDRNAQAIKIGKLSGYESLIFSPPQQMLSWVFQGPSSILIVQFPGVSSRSSVSQEMQNVAGSLSQR